MKVLIGAAAAVLLFTAAASAQTATTPAAPVVETPAAPAPPSRCPSPPADPTPPDGATVNNAGWQAAAAAFEVWRLATQASLECRAAEAREAQALSLARVTEYTALRTAALAVGQTMQAEEAEFNARPARSRR